MQHGSPEYRVRWIEVFCKKRRKIQQAYLFRGFTTGASGTGVSTPGIVADIHL